MLFAKIKCSKHIQEIRADVTIAYRVYGKQMTAAATIVCRVCGKQMTDDATKVLYFGCVVTK